MPYELFIALRYLRAKRRQAAVSVITGIAVAGIALGVAALLFAQALITGFRSDVQEKILRGTAHLNLLREDNGGIENYRELARRALRVPGVRTAAATIYAPALIELNDRQEQAVLKGVDTDAPRAANELFALSVEGDAGALLPSSSDSASTQSETAPPGGIVLGRQLAQALGAKLGDVVTAITAVQRLTPAGMQTRPRDTRFRIVGIFSSGLHEYDSKWGYIALSAAQSLSGQGQTAGVIQMNVADINAVGEVGARVRDLAGAGFMTTNWQELNRPLFAALQLQHRMVVAFFALLIAMAALNIITALTMMVIEKYRDIAILRAQGATPRSIRRIFIWQGLIIGACGAVAGLALGLGASWLANRYRLIAIPSEIYSVSFISLRVRATDCLWVTLLAVVICLLATLYPSRTAARLSPVEALRYE